MGLIYNNNNNATFMSKPPKKCIKRKGKCRNRVNRKVNVKKYSGAKKEQLSPVSRHKLITLGYTVTK
jgi:hypothetical protein